jgi:hypothetical protein
MQLISSTIDNKTLKEIQHLMQEGNLISRVRLQTAETKSLKKLRDEVENMIRRGHFRAAVRCLTLAADLMETQKPITMMTETNRFQLIELYRRRVWCQLQACEHPSITSANKLKYLNHVIEDCAFLLRIGCFKNDIHEGSEIYNDLTQMEATSLLAKSKNDEALCF